jgi:hemerythrin
LTNAWKRTHEELVSGIWEKKHAVSYLSVETVNKKAIEALIENAMNCKYFHFLDDNKELYPIEYSTISLLKEKFPAKYQMHPIPVI